MSVRGCDTGTAWIAIWRASSTASDAGYPRRGFTPGPVRDLIAAIAIDAWNQSPLTFEDRYGLMNTQQLAELRQSIDSGTSPQAAVTEWRAQSCRDNNGTLDAPGLGNTIEGVRALQEGLNRNGAQLEADGKFGPATTSAVENYQRSQNLDADGIAGPRTLAALAIQQRTQDAAQPDRPQTPRKRGHEACRQTAGACR